MKVSILGSTGSIGTQTLDVIRQHPEKYQVTSLSCGKNIDLLEKQVREFHPSFVAVWEEKDALDLKTRLSDLSVPVYYGMDGLIQTAEDPEYEILITAIVRMIAVRQTMEAIKEGNNIGLATKENNITHG